MLLRLNPTAEEAQALSGILAECKKMEEWVEKSAVPPKAPAAPTAPAAAVPATTAAASSSSADQVLPISKAADEVFEIEDGLTGLNASGDNIKIKPASK